MGVIVVVITRFYEHHLWTNLTLLAVCESLAMDGLEASINSTYGSIIDTWRHLASTEQAFTDILTGETTTPLEDDVPLAAVRSSLERSGRTLIDVAGTFAADSMVNAVAPSGAPMTLPAWSFLLQCLDHGNEHRQHIRMTLQHLGHAAPTIDTWAFLASQR